MKLLVSSSSWWHVFGNILNRVRYLWTEPEVTIKQVSERLNIVRIKRRAMTKGFSSPGTSVLIDSHGNKTTYTESKVRQQYYNLYFEEKALNKQLKILLSESD